MNFLEIGIKVTSRSLLMPALLFFKKVKNGNFKAFFLKILKSLAYKLEMTPCIFLKFGIKVTSSVLLMPVFFRFLAKDLHILP